MSLVHTMKSALCKMVFAEKQSYRYWRVRIMYATILGYSAFYIVRQNFSMALPSMSLEMGYDTVDLGWVASWFSFVYGAGRFINGYFSDKSNARYFMTFGLLASATISVFMSFGSSLAFFGFCWALNGWFQSMGWPPASRLVTHWFTPKELGTKWALLGSSHQIGAAIATLLTLYLVTNYTWREAFYVPAVLVIFMALFVFNRIRDTPKTVGLPPVEEYKGHMDHYDPKSYERITRKEVVELVFKNKMVWYVALANMCLYVPRFGVFTWSPMFLTQFKGASMSTAAFQTIGFEAAGLAGGLMAGWLSDRFFGAQRGPVGAGFLILLALSMAGLWLIPKGYWYLDALFLMLSGFLVYGPQVLVGVASADFASRRAIGVANGFTSVFGNIGAFIAGVGVGKLVKLYGWPGGFALFIVMSLAGAFFFSLTWKHNARGKQKS